MPEERKFMRTDFGVRGLLHKGDESYLFDLANLSLKGARIHCVDAKKFEKGDMVTLVIHLNNSEVEISTTSEIVHKETLEGVHFMGCKFVSIDAESMIHLRRLLELNTIPEGEIEKELSFLKD